MRFENTKRRFARLVWMGVMAGALAIAALPQIKLPANADGSDVGAWWPKNGVTINGVQPFKAAVSGRQVGDYRMTWRVDGGAETPMYDSSQDYPHKEAMVDVSGWGWNENGRYTITYTAYTWSGDKLGSADTTFKVPGGAAKNDEVPAESVAPAATAAPAVAKPQVKSAAAPAVSSGALGKLFVDPNSPAARQADAWRQSRPADAAAMDKLASGGTATWFGGWNADVRGDVDALLDRAGGSTPVLVAYNIPGRDCGSYSAGGAPAGAYGAWISAFTQGLSGRAAIVVLEPDALAQATCLSSGDRTDRYNLLASAVGTIKAADPRAKVYLDAGHAGWIGAGDMAARLKAAGVASADGFSLNVSNFQPTAISQAYGHALSALTGGKHFVIDTSRNGAGAAGEEWCNPNGRAAGIRPTTATNDSLADAFLWIKTPGESDGSCNGGPSAGAWWPDYALGLATRASF